MVVRLPMFRWFPHNDGRLSFFSCVTCGDFFESFQSASIATYPEESRQRDYGSLSLSYFVVNDGIKVREMTSLPRHRVSSHGIKFSPETLRTISRTVDYREFWRQFLVFLSPPWRFGERSLLRTTQLTLGKFAKLLPFLLPSELRHTTVRLLRGHTQALACWFSCTPPNCCASS